MASEWKLWVDQGSKVQFVVDVVGVDLTGYSARGKVRPDRISAMVLADWSSYLTVNVSAKQVVLLIPADITAAYDWDTARYDIEVYKPADATATIRIIQGDVKLDREVTR